ncbi:MAG: D-alanine--D-alanine ligase, partial [Planctomycetes bacterium]|nr:D-alanine--D-alanine ligase [Planctomycetota bacterium]
GGRSGEREVSLRSGTAVRDALVAQRGTQGLASLELVEIAADGRWLREGVAVDPARCVTDLPHDAVYFLALHGGDGEDGTIQGFLSSAGRAYTGSGVGASAIAMDKAATRSALAAASLRVAPGRLVQAWSWEDARQRELDEVVRLGDAGWFVKPNRGGSSVNTFSVRDADELPAAIDAVLTGGDSALVEARIPGTEATCGVLGNALDPRALPPVEIVPRGDRFFDYQQKYDDDGAEELCPPRSLGEETCAALANGALTAHRALGCEGYSRTDFIVPADGGAPVVLEVNTLPGLTARSLQPQAAAVIGLGFAGLCLEVLKLGLEADRSRCR